MKTNAIYLSIYFFIIIQSGFAQLSENILDINNFHVPVNSQGMIGFVEGTGDLSEVPAGSNIPAFYVSTLWLGAKERITGEVMGCIPSFHVDYNPFKPGPIYFSDLTIIDSVNYFSKYNRVWKVSEEQIEYHKFNYYKSDYHIPDAILHWPGNGDTTKGEAKILAPFTDYNMNEIYEPMLGDHPNIKGDQAVYAIYNSNIDDPESLASKMEIEVHTMLYAYREFPGNLLNNIVFVNQHIFNRSLTHDYDSLYAGQFVDFKLGCSTDDFVGSDSSLNLYYSYNGDYDEPCYSGYGNILPAIGYVTLTHDLFSFMIYIGDGSPLSYPTNVQHGYNYLRALFKDGTHLTYGGSGYGGTEKINHVFPSDVHDLSGWTEITEGNTPADRRGVGSMGPFQLSRGNDICIEMAFVFSHADIPGDNTASVDKLKEDVAQLNSFYPLMENETCVTYKTGTLPSVDTTSVSDFNIYPNPAGDQLFIQTNLQESSVLFAELYDATGRLFNIFTLVNTQDDQLHEIDTSNIPNGMYLLRINYYGHEFSEKIIIH
ncbi:MAG: T9SS type A sorting domain-containing protein [Fimbriimonadaceae bacterium]|nr:T9SS type A sorting domain-containing protein [Chitinophagales bacterium]